MHSYILVLNRARKVSQWTPSIIHCSERVFTKQIVFSDVAEIILNKCTVSRPDIKNPDDDRYRVVYNYEFMEDTSNKWNRE